MESDGAGTPRGTDRPGAANGGRLRPLSVRPPRKRDRRSARRRPWVLGLLASGAAHLILLGTAAVPMPSGPGVLQVRWDFAALGLPPRVEVPRPPEPIRRPELPRVREVRLEEAVELPSRPDPPAVATRVPPPPTLEAAAEPSYIRKELVPLLPDRRRYEMAMRRYYPGRLVRAGIQGRVELHLLVDEEGAVERIELVASSGHGRLDDAARRIARHLRYAPAMMRDRQVAVWVSQPFCFVVEGRWAEAGTCRRRARGAP